MKSLISAVLLSGCETERQVQGAPSPVVETSTTAADPATFCAMSWITVNVVTTRNGFLAGCAAVGPVASADAPNVCAGLTLLDLGKSETPPDLAAPRAVTPHVSGRAPPR